MLSGVPSHIEDDPESLDPDSKRQSSLFTSTADTNNMSVSSTSVHQVSRPELDLDELISAVERLTSRSQLMDNQRFVPNQRTRLTVDNVLEPLPTLPTSSSETTRKAIHQNHSRPRSRPLSQTQEAEEMRRLERAVQTATNLSYHDQRAEPSRSNSGFNSSDHNVELASSSKTHMTVEIAVETTTSSISLPNDANLSPHFSNFEKLENMKPVGQTTTKRRSMILPKRESRRQSTMLDFDIPNDDSDHDRKHLSMTHVELWQRLREKIGAAERDEGYDADDDKLGPNSLEVLLANENARRHSFMAHSDLIRPREDPFPYLVQLLPNLRSMLVSIQTTENDLTFQLSSALGRVDRLLVCSASLRAKVEIVLPVAANSVLETSVFRVDDCYEVKIAVAEDEEIDSRNNETSFEQPGPYSVKELETLKPFSIECDWCQSVIIRSDQIKSCAPMPSEGWSDLLDSWMCHGGAGGLSQSVAQAASQSAIDGYAGLIAKPASMLVSHTHFQTSAKDVVDHSVILADHQYPRCASCYSILGSKSMSIEGGASQYYLFKHAILVNSQTRLASPRYPIVTHLSARLLEKGKSHAAFKFVIEGGEQSQVSVVLWVFQPDTKIAVAMAPDWYQVDSRFQEEWLKPDLIQRIKGPMRAMKVMYQDVSTVTRVAPQADATVEHITYPQDFVKRLLTYLDATNTWQPPSQRVANNMKVGWLERI